MRVGSMVRQLVVECSGVVHAMRLAAMVKAVEGIIQGGRLTPATIGRNLPGGARPKHGIKCVDRLLGNVHSARDRMFIFLALAHRLLGDEARPVVLVDWTEAGGKHQALVAALPIGGRALPIYLEVHAAKKVGNEAVERRFLAGLKAVLPEGCRPIIVTDAGYRGPFFKSVRDFGWDFVGRIRGTSKAFSPDRQVVSKQEIYALASPTPRALGVYGLFIRQPISCSLVLVRKRRKPGPKRPPLKKTQERQYRQAALDPWLLATSLLDAQAAQVVSIYAKRMQIEETFRDAKNHRFGWSLGQVRLSSPRRTAALLVLATLAMVVVTLLGMGAERLSIHRAYQANTERRRVLSFFVLACAMLRRADWPPDLLGAFQAALVSVGPTTSQ